MSIEAPVRFWMALIVAPDLPSSIPTWMDSTCAQQHRRDDATASKGRRNGIEETTQRHRAETAKPVV
eukprot:3286118-Pleurochrysis_carterae.AAC.1